MAQIRISGSSPLAQGLTNPKLLPPNSGNIFNLLRVSWLYKIVILLGQEGLQNSHGC
jgi:hypothetical protein